MRPKYERPRDLTNEQRVAARMAERGIELRKLPISYRLDFAMFRDGKLRGFAETKARNNRLQLSNANDFAGQGDGCAPTGRD